MIALDERMGNEAAGNELVGKLALELGVELKKNAMQEAAAAIGIWLFDGSVDTLPGGYDKGELSPNSPVKELKSFPQDLVLVGRSTILIKGLSDRLDIPWSLAKEWAPIARQVLENNYQAKAALSKEGQRVRFHDVWVTFKQWTSGRATALVRKLPHPVRTRVAGLILKIQDRQTRRKLMKRGP
jgi:aarF domain-containing kinase